MTLYMVLLRNLLNQCDNVSIYVNKCKAFLMMCVMSPSVDVRLHTLTIRLFLRQYKF